MAEQNQRVGDAERDETTARLAEHFAAGRLDRFELDERMEQALSARTRGELDRQRTPQNHHQVSAAYVVVDLPPAEAAVPPLEVVDAASPEHEVQQQGPAVWRRTKLAPWAIFSVVFIVVWVATGAGYFWPVWPILGWGIGVAVSGIAAHTGSSDLPQIRGRRD